MLLAVQGEKCCTAPPELSRAEWVTGSVQTHGQGTAELRSSLTSSAASIHRLSHGLASSCCLPASPHSPCPYLAPHAWPHAQPHLPQPPHPSRTAHWGWGTVSLPDTRGSRSVGAARAGPAVLFTWHIPGPEEVVQG